MTPYIRNNQNHLAEEHRRFENYLLQESRIALSNVQLVCGTCGPVRIGHEMRGDRKVRVCKKCGTTLDK